MKAVLIVLGPEESQGPQAAVLVAAAAALPGGRKPRIWSLGSGSFQGEDVFPACEGLVRWERPEFSGYAPEALLWAAHRLWEEERPELVLLPGTLAGEQLAVELGAALGAAIVTNVQGLEPVVGGIAAIRPAYGNNLQAGLLLEEGRTAVLSLAETAWEPLAPGGCGAVTYRRQPVPVQSRWLMEETEPLREQEGLRSAQVLLAAGRGVGSREGTVLLEELAAAMGGQLGGTRPVVLDGWLPMERMIGASAAMLRPKLCLVMGASGAAPFAVGVEKSDLLVGVNTDPEALLFQYCDVGLVADWKETAQGLLALYQEG